MDLVRVERSNRKDAAVFIKFSAGEVGTSSDANRNQCRNFIRTTKPPQWSIRHQRLHARLALLTVPQHWLPHRRQDRRRMD